MAGSIGPMRAKRVVTLETAAHVFGSLVGALALALVLSIGAAVAAFAPKRGLALLAICGIALLALLQAFYPRIRLGSRSQVPRTWVEELGLSWALFAYGIALSFGLFTPTMSYTFWAFVIVALVAPVHAIAPFALAFGISRAMSALFLARLLGSPTRALKMMDSYQIARAASVLTLLISALFAWNALR